MKRAISGILAALSIAALAACGSGAAAETSAATHHHTDSTQPAAHDESDDSRDTSDVAFVLAFNKQHGDSLSEAGSLLTRAGEDVSDGDFDGGADLAERAADLFGEMHDDALDMPGADSALGKEFIHATGLCKQVLDVSIDALRNFDLDAMEASSGDLSECSDELTAIGDELTDY